MLLTLENVKNGDELKQFLGKNYSMNTLESLLWRSCQKGAYFLAVLLLNFGAPLSEKHGKTLLMVVTSAVFERENDREHLVDLLIEKGVPVTMVDGTNKTVLHYAVEFNRPRIISKVVDFFDRSVISHAFFMAVQTNDLELVTRFVVLGADVDYTGWEGITAASVAVCKNDLKLLQCLMYHGADANKPTLLTRTTPLNFAAGRNSGILKFLLAKGCNVNALTRHKNNALHYAAERGVVENARLLLNAGCNVNQLNNMELSPLGTACRKNCMEMVSLFLARGADPNLGRLALDEAVVNEDITMIDFLIKNKASVEKSHAFKIVSKSNNSFLIELLSRGFRVCMDSFRIMPYLEIKTWVVVCKKAAAAYIACYIHNEKWGQPVPACRFLTRTYTMYPIRRRIAAYLVPKRTVRKTVRDLWQEINDEL